jgi:hypothetical protein
MPSKTVSHKKSLSKKIRIQKQRKVKIHNHNKKVIVPTQSAQSCLLQKIRDALQIAPLSYRVDYKMLKGIDTRSTVCLHHS